MIDENRQCTGDPCLWACFPCLFTWMICEKGLQSCCMCVCCITPIVQERVNSENNEETKEEAHFEEI